MSSHPAAKNEAKLLCVKGLARRQGLVEFVEPAVRQDAEDRLSVDPRADLLLRHDSGVVREVFNERYGDLSFLSPASVQDELSKREALLRLVYRLYKIGRSRTPSELRRQLQVCEVEAVISSIQRLSFMGTVSAEELADFCETCAAQDDDLLAHVMDPLQLRYILTFHRSGTQEEMSKRNLDTLKEACSRRDAAGVSRWFQELTCGSETLPGDAPQFFRSILLDLWKTGEADFATFAYEIAVLDAQLFEVLGWESTRAFCAQLRRMTGPGCEVLDAFLTDEEIDGSLLIAEELKQEDLIIHFRKLATTYNTRLLRDMRRKVLSAAGHAREQDSSSAASEAHRASAPAAFRPLGWSAATS